MTLSILQKIKIQDLTLGILFFELAYTLAPVTAENGLHCPAMNRIVRRKKSRFKI